MQSEYKWTLADIKKKIENLEMRLLKAKRFVVPSNNSFGNINDSRQMNMSEASLMSSGPQKKNKMYISIAKKFITFANSILILFIQHGLKQETYDLLKK